MKVSHESPLALLDESRNYNDYDYCLVHLLPLYPKYLQFFEDSKKLGRKILLDNSMFELREAFEASQFAEWINKIKPNEYIVPDIFSDCNKTIESFKSWQNNYSNVEGDKIGVIQGTTYQEMINCYRFMSANADKIAISFECKYFHLIGYSFNENATVWERLIKGRQKFISDLIHDGIWAWHKPHHLLGCALPQEFKYYRSTGVHNIQSIDTSNPVVAGMHNLKYSEYGLNDKITTKLADLLESPISSENYDAIMFNIKKFRSINNIY